MTSWEIARVTAVMVLVGAVLIAGTWGRPPF